jgi:cytochrome c5
MAYSKLIRFSVLLLSIAGAMVAVSYADSSSDGKLLYRSNCKVCHDKGSPNGQYTPMTLTQDQWRKFYSSKLVPAHKNAIEPKSGKKLLEELTPAQLKAIQRFCVDHAADSEQPATCG